MHRLWIRRFVLVCVVMTGFFTLAGLQALQALQAPLAYAAKARLTITQPAVNNRAIGHVGTKVSMNGAGFTPGATVLLYTTTSAEAAQCANGNGNLNAFTGAPTVTVNADGTFAVGTATQVTWPDNAGTAGAAYYICAIARNKTSGTLSTNTFTVAQAVTINVSPTTVQPGGQVTVTGSNWFPPQPVTVTVFANTNENAPLVTDSQHNSNADGTITITLTLPTSAQQQTYTVHVFAHAKNEVNMTAAQTGVLTVMGVTPTPTPTPTPQPTPSPTATSISIPTPTPNTDTGPNIGTILLFVMGGLGVLLVVVGIILFIMYSRS